MRILVACEFSGVVSRSFRARGHESWSCDLKANGGGWVAHSGGRALVAGARRLGFVDCFS